MGYGFLLKSMQHQYQYHQYLLHISYPFHYK
nr:MAG TPA: hypothetical protein [Bacteriophage sp.]